jgi:hypothetical protein
MKRIALIALIALAGVVFAPARSPAESTCFSSGTECASGCSKRGLEDPGRAACLRDCQSEMDACRTRFQSELKTENWKKRCLALPDKERYLVDVVELAWNRTAALLRVQSLLLNHIETRLKTANEAKGAPQEREISSLLSTLDTKLNEFIHYFYLSQSTDTVAAGTRIFHDISDGDSAFDVLSGAASNLVVAALLDSDEANSLIEHAQSVVAMTHNLSQPGLYESASLSTKLNLIQLLDFLDGKIREIQSRILRVKTDAETGEPRLLLLEVQSAQHMCRQP